MSASWAPKKFHAHEDRQQAHRHRETPGQRRIYQRTRKAVPEVRVGHDARKQVNAERKRKSEGQYRYHVPILPHEQISAVKPSVARKIFKTGFLIHGEQYTLTKGATRSEPRPSLVERAIMQANRRTPF